MHNGGHMLHVITGADDNMTVLLSYVCRLSLTGQASIIHSLTGHSDSVRLASYILSWVTVTQSG